MISEYYPRCSAIRCSVPLLAVALVAGCSNNVRFQFAPLPPVPFVAPDNNGRFGANFRVLNLKNKDYAPGAFRVELYASYTAKNQSCTRSHIIPINSLLEAKTGKYTESKFQFDNPVYDPSVACYCSTATQCSGVVNLELQRVSGERAPGRYTKFSIIWDKSGELSEMQLIEQKN